MIRTPSALLRLLALLALLLPGAVLAQDDPEQPKIVTAIEFEGLKYIRDVAIFPKIETSVGQPYSEVMIDRDIKRLYRWNRFEYISTVRVDHEGGYKVIFRFVERPVVTSVVILNNFKIKTEKLMPLITTEVGSPLKEHTILADAEIIKKQYLEKGYGLVTVTAQQVSDGLGRVEIVFNVSEGPRTRITSIAIKGNEAFGDPELRKWMETKRKEFIFSSGNFDSALLDKDVERLTSFYRSKGYLDAKVDLEDLYYVNDFKEIKVQLRVDEGPQYYVGKIEFVIAGQAPDLIAKEELHDTLTLKEGEPVLWEKLERDRMLLRERYGRFGRAFTDVRFKPVFHENENIADLVWEINVGEEVYLNEIRIRGNYITQEKVIRRELTVYPGELIDLEELNKSIRRLRELDYFEHVEYSFWPSTEPDLFDLVVEVEEKKTGHFRFGVGFTTDGGATLVGEYVQRNFDLFDWPKKWSDWIPGRAFVGGGQRFSIRAQPSTRVSQFAINFREPYLFDHPVGLNLNLYSTVGQYIRSDIFRTGFGVGFDWRLRRNLRASVAYNILREDVFDVSIFAPREVLDVKGVHWDSSLTLALDYDSTDSQYLPSRGWLTSLSYTYSGGFLGGDWDYHRVLLDIAKYQTVYENAVGQKHILTMGTRFGWMDEFGDSTFVPMTHRFFAGGLGSVRGFAYNGIGPESGGVPVGGKASWISTVEYTFPIPVIGDAVRGAVFMDAGNIASDWNSLKFSETRLSVGFGFRVTVPFLGPTPVRLDFGFPIWKEKGDSEEFFNFGVSSNF